VSSGLEYVVAGGLFHGDVKSANIVLKNGIPKRCDFGSASFMRQNSADYEKSIITCTPLWAAPEVTFHNWRVTGTRGDYDGEIRFNDVIQDVQFVDVFSFAIVMYEVLHEFPYKTLVGRDFPLTYIQYWVAINNLRPTLDDTDRRLGECETLDAKVALLMKRCWHHEPKKRMPFNEIRECLTEYLNEYRKGQKTYGTSYLDMPVITEDDELAVEGSRDMILKTGCIGESGASIKLNAFVSDDGIDGISKTVFVLPKDLRKYKVLDTTEYALALPIMDMPKVSNVRDGAIFENIRGFFKLHKQTPDIWLQFDGISVIQGRLMLCARNGSTLRSMPDLIPVIDTWIDLLNVLHRIEESGLGQMVETLSLDNVFVDGKGKVKLNMWDILMKDVGFGCTDSLKTKSLSDVMHIAPEVKEGPEMSTNKSFVFTVASLIKNHVTTLSTDQRRVVDANLSEDPERRVDMGTFACNLQRRRVRKSRRG